jgi:hypothetical protein
MEQVTAPRPLTWWEEPRPGDFVFETGRAWTSRLIQIGTADDLNHVAIITGDDWLVVEAVGEGVIEHHRERAHGYVVRVTDDPVTADTIVAAARRLAGAGLGYSWPAIIWHVGVTVASFPGLGGVGRYVAALAGKVLPCGAMVCSEVALTVLRDAAQSDVTLEAVLAPLDGTPAFQVSPARLFRTVCNRRDWRVDV